MYPGSWTFFKRDPKSLCGKKSTDLTLTRRERVRPQTLAASPRALCVVGARSDRGLRDEVEPVEKGLAVVRESACKRR